MKTYIIQNAAGDYWKHDFDWTYYEENATRYNEKEFNTCELPLGGYWVEIETKDTK